MESEKLSRIERRAQKGSEILKDAHFVYEMRAAEMAQLVNNGKRDRYEPVFMAYDAGFYAGILYQKNRQKKARKGGNL